MRDFLGVVALAESGIPIERGVFLWAARPFQAFQTGFRLFWSFWMINTIAFSDSCDWGFHGMADPPLAVVSHSSDSGVCGFLRGGDGELTILQVRYSAVI